MAGAPKGNTNAAKAKVWTAAIERALEKRSLAERKDAIDDLAEKLLEQCDAGNLSALQELGNRLEGKPRQDTSIEHSGTVHQTHTHIAVSEIDQRIADMLGGREDSDSAETLPH